MTTKGTFDGLGLSTRPDLCSYGPATFGRALARGRRAHRTAGAFEADKRSVDRRLHAIGEAKGQAKAKSGGLPEVIYAQASPRSIGGTSLFDAGAVINSVNVGAFFSDAATSSERGGAACRTPASRSSR